MRVNICCGETWANRIAGPHECLPDSQLSTPPPPPELYRKYDSKNSSTRCWCCCLRYQPFHATVIGTQMTEENTNANSVLSKIRIDQEQPPPSPPKKLLRLTWQGSGWGHRTLAYGTPNTTTIFVFHLPLIKFVDCEAKGRAENKVGSNFAIIWGGKSETTPRLFNVSLVPCLSKDQNVWNPLEAAKLTKRRKISLPQRQQTKTSNLGSL